MAGNDALRKRWEQRTAWPGVVASGVFLVAYSWYVLQEHQPADVQLVLLLVLGAIWLFYLIDYVVRFVLAEHKLSFVQHSVVDLLSVFFPVARPFRLLTGLTRIRALRGNTPSHLRRRVLIFAGSLVVMFIYVISLAEFQVERFAEGSNIRSFGDSLWWACVTMATVGYGDYYPVTVPGRMLAVVLMMGGIAIVGTASATIVSYLNERTVHLRTHDPRLPPRDDDKDERA